MIYDAAGNITSKSGVAYRLHARADGCTYYSNTQPHAVRKVGTAVYCYDANGNMVQRREARFPGLLQPAAVINQGANQAQFPTERAGPLKEVTTVAAGACCRGPETTLYFGGMFEKVTKPSGVIEYNIHHGGKEAVALRTLRSNSVNTSSISTRITGERDTITNASAAIAVKLSFDAFRCPSQPERLANPPSAGQ